MDRISNLARHDTKPASIRRELDKQLTRQGKTEQSEKLENLEKADKASKEQDKQESGLLLGRRQPAPRLDRYEHGEKQACAGLQRLSQDENGNKTVIKDESDQENGMLAAQAGAVNETGDKPDAAQNGLAQEETDEKDKDEPKKTEDEKKKVQKCVCNTDKVDEEIRKLKKKQTELKQQVAQAKDDPDKEENLKRELEQVENELRTKDTDAYRRAHSHFANI